MIQLIIGDKGSGKTKALIDIINDAAKDSQGKIVCIEKSMKLTYSINHTVRVIDVDDYAISGYETFYGFVCGILASDYDIDGLYVDGILKIGSKTTKDFEGLVKLLKHIDEVTPGINVVITVSDSGSNLPAELLDRYEVIDHDKESC